MTLGFAFLECIVCGPGGPVSMQDFFPTETVVEHWARERTVHQALDPTVSSAYDADEHAMRQKR